MSDVKVDHIEPVGTLKCLDDVKGFMGSLFCSQDNLQIMCDDCHKVKTKEERRKK